MAKKNRKRGRSGRIFYPVYWSLVLIGVAAILLMMRVLWDNMEDYEASMPKHVAREAEKIFTSRDFETMYEYDDVSACEAEGKEAYVNYMRRLTQGQEIVCREIFSANADEKAYKIMVGDTKLGTYTLGKNGERTAYGNELWALKEIRTNVIHPQSYLITVPETSSVYADGVLLDESAIIERGIQLSGGYLPEGFEAGGWCTYSVERCFSIPAFRVEDRKGREQAFLPNEEGRLTAQVNYDDDLLRGEVEERVIKTARAFSQFTSDDCSSTFVMNFIKEDSKAEKYIRSFDGGWVLPHKGFDYANMRTEKYVQYDENTFSCEVYFDYIIKYKKTTETYPTAYVFVFEKQGDEWALSDFTMAM